MATPVTPLAQHRTVTRASIRHRIFSFFCIAILVIIPPLISINSPHSKLFWFKNDDPILRRRMMDYNARRLQAARRYVEGQDPEKSLIFYNSLKTTRLDIVVSVLTVRRPTNETMGFLLQSVSALDKLIKKNSTKRSIYMFVCNTDRSPLQHTDANYLQQYVPQIRRFNNKTSEYTPENDYERMKNDYIFCLNSALKHDPKYVMMVEDDALARKELFEMIDFTLDYQFGPKSFTNSNKNITALQLYYPERWQGFGFELDRILELVSLGIVFGTVLTMIFQKLQPVKRTWNTRVVFVFFFVFCIIFLWIFGRPHLLELRRLSPYFYRLRISYGCCIPAILYSSDIIDGLCAHLNSVKTHANLPHDVVIFQYLKSSAFLIEPNLFRHIGYYSTIQTNKKKKPLKEFLFRR